jgi:Tol biopolymer transport system component
VAVVDGPGLVADLAAAILDGKPIDWASAESSADGTDRETLDYLKLVATIADIHRRPAIPLTWGHLRVLERIGGGAFGDVYRAWDTRLDREVALKLLPASSVEGEARASSIIQEGRLLARVRHPNVVTIYGAERIGDRIGLWMEFVKGETLEEVLRRRKVLTPAEVVKIARELCQAIAAVHGAGLLHRDIKAQNVVLTADGRVVLMDFGSGREADDDPGRTLAGTPLYLAPELFSDNRPTSRSDIYSFGVLLYHLVTGSYPVRGQTLRDLRVAHERGERIDVKTLRPDAPPKLARIIARALDPEPEGRYETAEALAADLKALDPRPRLVRLSLVFGIAAAAMAILWIGFEIRGRQTAEQRTAGLQLAASAVAAGSSQPARIVALNKEPGTKTTPALSPDGSRIAFMWDRGAGHELYVQSLDAGASQAPVRVTDKATHPAWSPDGRALAFIRRFADDRQQHAGDGVVVVEPHAGTERLVWMRQGVVLGAGLDWSPDGTAIVVPTRTSNDQPWRLSLISLKDRQARWISSPAEPSVGDSYPTYSPDGSLIAFVRDSGSGRSFHVLHLGDGSTVRVTVASTDISRPAWTADGQSLIYAAHEGAAGGANSLWRVPIDGGAPQRVAGTGEGASHPATGRQTARVVFIQSRMDQNLYKVALADGPAVVVPLAGTSQQDSSPDLSPGGGRVVFSSDRSGHPEIWTVGMDGSDARQITHMGGFAGRPRWSPDAQQIAFEARASGSGHNDIFVVSAAGGSPRRLTTDVSNDVAPSWSADGTRLYYLKHLHGGGEIWKVPAAGGPTAQVTREKGRKAHESTDGRFLYYSSDARAIWRVPVEGGARTFVMSLPRRTTWGGHWAVTDDGIYWLNVDASPRPAIEFFGFATSTITRAVLPSRPYDDGSEFSVSRDGRWLVFAQRDYEASDLMMIESTAR